MKKRIFSLFLALILAAALAVPVFAQEMDTFVLDPVYILEDDEIDSLNVIAQNIYDSCGVNVLFAAVDENEAPDIPTDPEELYELWAGAEDGILFVCDFGDNHMNCYRMGGVCDVISEEDVETFYDLVNDAPTWYDAAYDYICAAGEAIMAGYGVEASDGEALPTAKIMDEADLLTDAEETALLDQLEDIAYRRSRDVAVVTVDTMGSYSSVGAFTDNYYYTHDYDEDAVLLLINMGERDWIISVYGDCEEIFVAAGREYIGDNIVPMLSSGDYFEAFTAFGEYCDDFIGHAILEEPYTANTLPRGALPLYWIAIALGIGLVLGLVVVFILRSQLKSVKFKESAAEYVVPGSLNVTGASEIFLYSHVDRTAKPKDNGGSSGSSHSSGHSTSGKF